MLITLLLVDEKQTKCPTSRKLPQLEEDRNKSVHSLSWWNRATKQLRGKSATGHCTVIPWCLKFDSIWKVALQYPRKRDVENEKHNKISNVHVYAWHRIRCFKYKNIKQNYSILENIMVNCIQNFFKDFGENKFYVWI